MNFASLTTCVPNGITNASPYQTMGSSGSPDPTYSHIFHSDFDSFVLGNYAITQVGQGTQALIAGDGGLLQVTNTAGASDSTHVQLAQTSFALKAGKFTFFKFSGTLSDVITNSFFTGLAQQGATSLATITDGIVLVKAAGAATLAMLSIKNGVTTQLPLPSIDLIVAGVPFELGLVVDSQGNLAAFFNPTTGSNASYQTNAVMPQGRGRVAALYSLPASGVPLSVTTAVLAPMFNLTNASAAARSLTVDFITVSRER